MPGALRELVASFTTEANTKPLEDAGKKLEGLGKAAASMAVTFAAAFGVKEIFGFVESQVEAAAQLGHTAEMLGMTTEQMERFNYAASTMGISSEEASNSLRFLNRNIGEAATKGGDGAAAFAKLGVHLKDANGQIRPTGDVLGEVADGFAKLPSPAVKTATAMQLFGRAGARMIPFLNQGSAGVAGLNAEFDALGGGMSKDFINSSLKAEHEMAKLHLVSEGLKSTLVGALMPAFTWMVEKMTSAAAWLRELNTHSDYVKNTLGALGAVLLGVAGYWAVLNAGMVASVVGFIMAALVIDDVITAAKGGKSVFGDWVDGILGLGATQAIFQQLNIWLDDAKLRFQMFATVLGSIGTLALSTANSIRHAVGAKSDAEYERDKATYNAQDAKDSATYDAYGKQLDANTAKDNQFSVADEIDKNENAYAQSKDPNGPNLPKMKAWDMTNHFGKGYMTQPEATVAPPAGSAGAANVTNHVTQNANVTVNAPSGSPKDVARATVDATRKALTETHEDTHEAAPAGGGH